MIKKISFILLSIFLFLSFNICAVGALPAAAEITSPLSGDTVGEDFSEVLFSAPEGAFVSLKLDGDEIFSGTSVGNNSAQLSEEISFGKHNLVLSCVSDNALTTDSIVFSKEKTVSKTYDNVEYRDFGTYEAGIDAEGNKVYATPGKFFGKDGSEEGSIGYKIENLDGRLITKGSLAHDFYFAEYKDEMVDKVTLSFDLKINNAYYFEFEMKNGDGGWINPGGKTFFKTDYTIGSTGKSYPNNGWMAMEMVFDVPAQTIAIYIDGEKVINEYKAEAHLRGLQMLRFLHCPRAGVALQGYSVDNFKLITEYRYRGFNEVSYKDGDVYEDAFGDKITKSFNEIRFKTDMLPQAFKTAFNTKCFADGQEAKVEKLTFASALNEESGLMENFLTVTLKDKLFGESNLKFVFDNTLNDDTKIAFDKNISLSTENFGIGSMEYFLNGAPCISSDQLKAGDTLKAKFNLRNYSAQSAVCVVGIYSGEKLVALSSKTIEGASCEVSTLIPSGESSYRAECFVMDGYTLRKSLSNTKYIGGSND